MQHRYLDMMRGRLDGGVDYATGATYRALGGPAYRVGYAEGWQAASVDDWRQAAYEQRQSNTPARRTPTPPKKRGTGYALHVYPA
jgi:hypothetical protein